MIRDARRLAGLAALGLAIAAVGAVPAAAQSTLLRAAHLVDPATGTLRDDVAVLVTDGRIAAIGGRDLAAPAGAEVLDLGDVWLMPGLMDTHTHLSIGVIASEMREQSNATNALIALRNAQQYLQGGFTTVRDLGAEGDYAVVDLRRAIDSGMWSGPTILSAGKTIAPFGGDRDRVSPLPFEAGPTWRRNYIDADSPQEMVKAVRENIRYGARVIKLYADIHPYHFTREEVGAAVAEARRAGVRVAAHVAGGRAADEVIAAGVDSIEHGFSLSREQLAEMKKRGIYLSGTDFGIRSLRTILRDEKSATGFARLILERLREAHRIGVPLAYGSDVVWAESSRPRSAIVLDQTETWVAAGIAPLDVLKAMTSNAAALLGVQDQRGAIRVGLFADLVAMPADPVRDIAALRGICFVMKQGRVERACPQPGAPAAP
jgi:imidazolonepropionase-like amidohydrolase